MNSRRKRVLLLLREREFLVLCSLTEEKVIAIMIIICMNIYKLVQNIYSNKDMFKVKHYVLLISNEGNHMVQDFEG